MLLPLVLLAMASPSPAPQTDKAWTVISDALSAKDTDRRVRGIHVLGNIHRNAKAEKLVLQALTDASSDVRAEAAAVLGHLHLVSAKAKLHEALKDKDLNVVIAAANALYAMKDPIAFDVYYALLTGERKSSAGLLQTQLDTLHDRKQMEKLAFETGIGFVPFGGMGWEAWKTITRDDSSPVKAAAAEKLATDPDPRSADALVWAAHEKKWRVRAAAANAIGIRGDSKLLSTLNYLLDDENDTVRLEAAAAIIEMSKKRKK
jgi:HEAT repeat protein